MHQLRFACLRPMLLRFFSRCTKSSSVMVFSPPVQESYEIEHSFLVNKRTFFEDRLKFDNMR